MKYYGECLVGTDNCVRYGKSGQKVNGFPNVKGSHKWSEKAQTSCYNVDAPRFNLFYCIRSRG